MEVQLYGIVDAAQDPGLHELVLTCPERACLFAGPLRPPLHMVAPYLVRLDSDTPLTHAWHREGWGHNWGILCLSTSRLEALRRHLRQFLQAMLPDGEIVLFRFYDPRVFRSYFPALEADVKAGWFEMVEEYRVETPAGAGTLYFRADGTRTVMHFDEDPRRQD